MLFRPRLALCIAMLCLASGAPATETALRRLIGPGDLVPGFGRIGAYGITALGVDDAGRTLIRDDAAGGLWWASEHGLAAAIDAQDAAALGFWRYRDVEDVHPSGAFVLSGADPAGHPALYAVDGGRARRVAGGGDRDAAGGTLCQVSNPRINRAGAVAFEARIAPHGRCEPQDENDASWALSEALYRVDAAGLRRLPRSGSILALTEDGTVLLASGDAVSPDGVVAALPVPPHRVGPSGAAVAIDAIYAAGRGGTVLFRGTEAGRTGLYRGDSGGIERLYAAGDVALWGLAYPPPQYPGHVAVNAAGDVLLAGFEGTVLFPAGGTPRRIATESVGDGWLNDAGAVALTHLVSAAGGVAVTRWDGAVATRLATSGDALPGGGFLLQHGLSARCLGPDGSVAVVAEAMPDAQGLLCGDAGGFQASVRAGDGTPVGRRFYAFAACAIPRPGELVFVAQRLLPSTDRWARPGEYRIETALYRATAGALERLVGPGDVTDDHAAVAAVELQEWSNSAIATNAGGDVLVRASLDDTPAGTSVLLVRDAAGGLRRLPLALSRGFGSGGIHFPPASPVDHEYLAGLRDTPRSTGDRFDAGASHRAPRSAAMASGAPNGAPAFRLYDAHLLDDGAVVVLGQRGDDAWGRDPQVLLIEGDAPVALFTPGDEMLAGAGIDRLDAVAAAGDRVVVQGSGPHGRAFFGWQRATGAHLLFRASDLPDASPGHVSLCGVDTGGRVLVQSYRDGDDVYRRWDAGMVTEVARVPLNEAWLVAAERDGSLLFSDGTTAVVTHGEVLAARSCPVPPTLVLPTLTVTATPTDTPTASPTRTVTPRRSASPARTPTAIPVAPPCGDAHSACVRVGEASGAPGGRAELAVHLDSEVAVAGIANDLVLPAGARAVSCTVDAAIDKPDTAFRFDQGWLRAVVLSLTALDPIAAGARLYTCAIAIDPSAEPGAYPIACAGATASAPAGQAVATGCEAGTLRVAAATPTAALAPDATLVPPRETPTVTPAAGNQPASGGAMPSGGGCAVAPAAGERAWGLLAATLLLLGRRRR